MEVSTILELAFAAGVILAGIAVGCAFLGRVTRETLVVIAAPVGVGATAGWIGFAFALDRDSAVAAAGLTACFFAALASTGLLRGVERAARIDEDLAEAEGPLHGLVEREAAQRTEELERTLARARADSVSRLAEEERRIADPRRAELAEGERRTASALGDPPTRAERPVEQR